MNRSAEIIFAEKMYPIVEAVHEAVALYRELRGEEWPDKIIEGDPIDLVHNELAYAKFRLFQMKEEHDKEDMVAPPIDELEVNEILERALKSGIDILGLVAVADLFKNRLGGDRWSQSNG